MRIVQLVETLETGGLERIAVDLALAQQKAGHTPILYCMFSGGPLADEARAAGIPVIEFHKKPGFSVKMMFTLARQLRRDRADVLHTHNPGVHHYGAVSAWMARVPVVVNTRHGPATSFGRAYQERYFRAVMPLTDRVIFVCEDSRRYLIEKRGLPSAKSAVIINGIELEPFLERPASPRSASPRIRFGAVGRMVPVKEAGLNGRIHIEGLNNQIADVLRELDVFVMSSTSEGLPLVILEAMAAGLPVVSTRIGGIPEVAPEGSVSVLCAPGSADDLAEAMYRAATICDLACMGKTAREMAIAKFSLGQMWRRYEAVYNEARERN